MMRRTIWNDHKGVRDNLEYIQCLGRVYASLIRRAKGSVLPPTPLGLTAVSTSRIRSCYEAFAQCSI